MGKFSELLLEKAGGDNHDDAVKHLNAIVRHTSSVRDNHSHDAKRTGAHPVSKEQMGKLHDSLVGNGYSHKANKDNNVHVYKKGSTTVTHYHGDEDVNVHTKKQLQTESMDDNAARAHAKAKEQSIKHGAVQHVNRDEDGHHHVSDWYDSDSTVASYEKGRRLDESTGKFHYTGSVPHKEVMIHGDHREAAHKLEDGKHASHPPGGHLLTSYKGDGDSGTSHFVKTKREGDVVHFHDYHTGRHVATVSHADLEHHNPTKNTKFIK